MGCLTLCPLQGHADNERLHRQFTLRLREVEWQLDAAKTQHESEVDRLKAELTRAQQELAVKQQELQLQASQIEQLTEAQVRLNSCSDLLCMGNA